jgi:hypothetical protein
MAKILVEEDGVRKSERRTLNFIEGSGMTITITEDPGTENRVNIQLDSAGGPGGGSFAVDTGGNVA